MAVGDPTVVGHRIAIAGAPNDQWHIVRPKRVPGKEVIAAN